MAKASASVAALSAFLAVLVLALRAAQVQEIIELTVEKRQGTLWQPVSPHTVFHANDNIRFKLRTQLAGYLYVLNHESGGNQRWLYPRPEQDATNRIEPDKTYSVPDSKGSFEVGGQPGFDITYWMITPEPMSVPVPEKKSPKPNTLLPRCGGELLKSRGLCEDEQAGPHPISDSADVPSIFSNSGGLISRDLTFQAKKSAVQIITPEPQSGSVLYALWIAHR